MGCEAIRQTSGVWTDDNRAPVSQQAVLSERLDGRGVGNRRSVDLPAKRGATSVASMSARWSTGVSPEKSRIPRHAWRFGTKPNCRHATPAPLFAGPPGNCPFTSRHRVSGRCCRRRLQDLKPKAVSQIAQRRAASPSPLPPLGCAARRSFPAG